MKYVVVILAFLISTALGCPEQTCGGIVDDGDSGVLHYEAVGDWENCIWAIKVGNKSQAVIRRAEEAHTTGQISSVRLYRLGPNGESVDYVSSIRAGDTSDHLVSAQVFFIQFTSGEGQIGASFRVTFEGIGRDATYLPPYDFQFFTASSGKYDYPEFPVPERVYGRFSVALFIPQPQKAVQLLLKSPIVARQSGGISAKYCTQSMLGIYEFNSYVPRQVLSFCRPDRLQNYTIVSPSPILIRFKALFNSSPTTPNGEYHVEWEDVDFECRENAHFC